MIKITFEDPLGLHIRIDYADGHYDVLPYDEFSHPIVQEAREKIVSGEIVPDPYVAPQLMGAGRKKKRR
jgi:hypothetical protein